MIQVEKASADEVSAGQAWIGMKRNATFLASTGEELLEPVERARYWKWMRVCGAERPIDVCKLNLPGGWDRQARPGQM